LARGRIDAERLRDLLASSLPPADPLGFAVEVTSWPRCDAECSPERGSDSHPSRHSAGQPSIAGWAFQWIAQLSVDRDSWTVPVDAARLHPLADTDQQAAVQVRAVPGRLPVGGPVPVLVFDGGDDSAQLTLDSPTLQQQCWCGCALTAAAPPTRRQRRVHQGRSAAPPWRQVRLRRPDDLADPDRPPPRRR
jgi:hypothetical protein